MTSPKLRTGVRAVVCGGVRRRYVAGLVRLFVPRTMAVRTSIVHGVRCAALCKALPVRYVCFVLFFCPPGGGSGSRWLKHASKQRSPTTLVDVVRAVVVLVLERAFVVGGEAVAVTTRALAGRGRDLD